MRKPKDNEKVICPAETVKGNQLTPAKVWVSSKPDGTRVMYGTLGQHFHGWMQRCEYEGLPVEIVKREK